MTAPRAVVVLTGSELVRGDKEDRNGAFLARELTRLGLEPERIAIVGDAPGALEQAVREGLEADLCILSGGLGPTHDDRTIEMLAHAAGRALVVDAALEREIEAVARGIAERLTRPYEDFAPGVRKQASLPEGGVALGLAGTAPAVLLERDGRVAVTLPGPPEELRRLWPRVLEAEALQAVIRRAELPRHRVLRLFGPSESAVARLLEESGGEGGGLDVTICAHAFEIRVDVFARGDADERAERLAQAVRERFGDDLFAEDERTVAELVLDRCRELGWTLATAESCTGGLVGARLTEVPGASAVYAGGFVAYANEAKARLLGVPMELLERHGAVSPEAAAAMAHGARRALGAEVALAVTGIAGPGGGTEEKPVGLVVFHAAAGVSEWVDAVRIPGDREAVRSRATALALHGLRRLLARTGTHAHDPGG
ncbi:MAG TPA: CinA family nicotinamide mononucleotide deamidase-related protein [Gaiellaceae bacterium]|nr:CinA family nicotinamide mononucleotide deamidase-related protein [Gaiellaceae bacterium]